MGFMSRDFDLIENIFYFHNLELKSMSFVLDWDTKEKFYFNLLSKSFADVLDVSNDHSMVLARPGQTDYFHQKIPAFDIRYVEDCFKIKDYPDPTKYLIKNTCPANYTKDDIYDCWLYQNKSWSDLVSIPQNKTNSCAIEIKSSSNPISLAPSFNYNDDNDDDDDDDDDDDIMLSKNPLMASTSKHTRMPYSQKEEISIINYIIKNNYAFDVSGVTMWQRMERDNVCKYRTWQSMKQRYLKHIKLNLNSGTHRYPFLLPKDLKLLRQGLKIDKINKNDEAAIKSRLNEDRLSNWNSDSS